MGTGASVDDNTPDKHSGLSKRQKVAVRKIWKQVEANTQKHCVKIFIRFFEKYPGYRKYFVSKSGEEMTKVAEDAHVQSHFRAIVASISTLIKAIISKPKSLDERLNYIAMLHKDLGIGMKDFGNFRDVLVEYMKTEFPKEMNIFEITAWNMFLTTMFQRICTRMDEINKQEQDDKMDSLPSPQNAKKRGLLKRIFKGKNKPDPEYWRQRKVYWRMQKELWSENKSDSSDEGEGEAEKDVATQFTDAVASVFGALHQDADVSVNVLKEQVSDLSNYDIPVPEGGFARRGSQAPRANAGNMRPKSPSSRSANHNPSQESAADGCMPCSSARGRRRNSFNESYQLSNPPPD